MELFDAFALLGALVAGTSALSMLMVLYRTLLRGGKNLKKAYGEWAVVTGATDGIGKAMAFEMARKGMNIMLIARSQSKLDAVKKEAQEKYPNVTVATELCDFAAFDKDVAAKLGKKLDKLEVGVLVNNVGISYAFPQWFHELNDGEIQSLLTVNIDSAVWMTRAVLPQMLERKKGAVVMMSSASARPPSPLLSVYAATKGFIENFTKGMAVEYSGKGVHFQCQSPLFVSTNIVYPNSKVPVEKRATLSTPTAKTYAKYAVSRIGYDTMVSPYWVHEVLMWFQDKISDDVIGMGIMSMHKGIRFAKKNVALMAEKKAQ